MASDIEVSFDKLEKLFERYDVHIPQDIISHLSGEKIALHSTCFNLERPSFHVAFLVEPSYQNNDTDKGLLAALTGETNLDAIFDVNALGINVYKGYVCSCKDSKVPPELQDET